MYDVSLAALENQPKLELHLSCVALLEMRGAVKWFCTFLTKDRQAIILWFIAKGCLVYWIVAACCLHRLCGL